MCNENTSSNQKIKGQNYRVLPWASEIVWFPITLFCAILHVLCSYTLSSVEPIISSSITGGLFGLIIIPIFFGYSTLCVLQKIILDDVISITFLLRWIGIPFGVYYILTIIILDRSQFDVERSNPHPTRNALECASESFLKAVIDYFPITCVPWEEKGAKLPTDGNRQYLFAIHPHGIHCFPMVLFSTPGSDFDKKFPNLVGKRLTGLVATVIFKIPVVRELFLCMGYADASRSVASKALSKGRSIYICIGGEEESLLTTNTGKDILVLKNRKGFIRLALSHGVDIVPVFGIGNNDLFTTYTILSGIRRWVQKTFHIALPIFHGRYGITPIPYQHPIHVVIGKPIQTPQPKIKGEKPSSDLVDEYHAIYIQALKELHSKHTGDDRVLEIR